MTNLDEAYRMIDTFASCGANSFVVTKTELEWPGHKKGNGARAIRLMPCAKSFPA